MPVCSHCRAVLHPSSAHRKYCSDRCRYKAWKARQPVEVLADRECVSCGVGFVPSNRGQRSCTVACYRAAYNAEQRRLRVGTCPERDCARCGGSFRSGNPLKRFCSSKCQQRAQDEKDHPAQVCFGCGTEFRRKGRRSPLCAICLAQGRESARKVRWPGLKVLVPCPVCAVHFARPVPTQRCCSIACANRIRFGPLQPERRRVWTAGSCATCGEAFVSAFPHARFCSGSCERRESRRLRRDRKRAQHVERVFRRKVYERDNWTCRICRKPINRGALVPDPKAPTIDHILPLALGGTHEYSNVQTAHFICNSRKSANVSQLSFAA